jgi:hypothetical protein
MNYDIFFRTVNNKNISSTKSNYILEKKIDIKLDQNKLNQTKLDEKNLQEIKVKDKNEIYDYKMQEKRNEIINSFYFDDFF